MKSSPLVKQGDWVLRGKHVGYCGTSGESSGPHAHYDIFNTSKYGWTFYVYGWTLAKVKSVFRDPAPYCKGNIPMVAEFPKVGYRFLQPVRHPSRGLYYHPGVDLNGLNDYGKPILSPVEGRVVYVSDPGPLDRVWKKYFGWVPYFKGWGWVVVIEEKPGFTVS
jgi:murein DD-endopeptidase MepM/ murein hydrolase activator NlpD